MSTLKDKIIEWGLEDHVLTDIDLTILLGGTPASRYGLINKALHQRDLIRICRGLYTLSEPFRRKKISKFYLSNRMVPQSYVSLESALSYHGWIPESVPTVISVLSGRTKQFTTPFGEFAYYQLPINPYEFLTCVNRAEEIQGEPFLVASPLRALTDYVYIRKIEWESLETLIVGMRIEEEKLAQISKEDLNAVRNIYRSKRVLHFIDQLAQGIQSS